MNSTYDILQSIMNKPPIIEEPKVRAKRTTLREDATVLQLIKKLSAKDLAALLASK